MPGAYAPPPVTVPPADGEALVVSVQWVRTKCAVTLRAVSIVTEQVLEPVQSPDQRSKRKLALAVAVTVMAVPWSYLLVTVPSADVLVEAGDGVAPIVPPPDGATRPMNLRVRTKWAVTERSALIVTEQVPEPVQAPDQRSKR